MDHNLEIKKSFRKPILDPPPPPAPEELASTKAHIREKYIHAGIWLKTRAEVEAAELGVKKTTLTPEELKVEGARVQAELVRAEKEYQTMLERAKPTTEEVEAAKRKMIEKKK